MTDEPWSSKSRIAGIIVLCFGLVWLLFGRGCGQQQQNIADQPPQEDNTSVSSTDVSKADRLPQLLTLLNSDDATKRAEAATEIGALGMEASSAIEVLTAKLSDPDPKVRAAAAAALHQVDTEGVSLAALAEAGQAETDATTRKALWLAAATVPTAALTALCEKQPDVVNTLISGLRGSDADVQAAITKSLADTKLTEEQQSLAAIYQITGVDGSTNADVQSVAKASLDQKPAIAIQQLISEINDESSPEAVRNDAASLLTQLAGNLPDADREDVNAALAKLQFGSVTNADNLAPLALMMAAANVEHAELPTALLYIATNAGQPASIRIQAAELIGKTDSLEVAQQLAAALSAPTDSDAEQPSAEDQSKLQLALLSSLQRQSSATPEAAAAIAKFANAGPLSPEVQAASLKTLMTVAPGSESLTPLLQSGLSSDNDTVRAAAIKAAGSQDADQLRVLAPALAAIAASGQQADQSEALALLNKVPKAAAPFVGQIATALGEGNDAKVQAQAMGLLSSIGGNLENLPEDQSAKILAGVTSILKSDDAKMRSKAAGLISASGLLSKPSEARDSAVNALAENLSDKDSDTRMATLNALASAGKIPKAAQKSLNQVLSNTADPKEAKLAMTALAGNATSDEKLQQQVAAVLANDKLSSSADDILSSLGDKQISVLTKIANGDDKAASNKALALMSTLAGTDSGKAQLQAIQTSDDQQTRTIASLLLGDVPQNASSEEVTSTLASALSMPGLAKQTKALTEKLGSDAIGPLTSIATDSKASEDTRSTALEMLSAAAAGNSDPAAAIAALTSVMESDPGRVGTESAIALATVDPSSKPAVERLAADISKQILGVDPKAIVAALEHMAASGNGAAIATLGRVITNDKLPDDVKQKAFAAIMSQDHNTDPVKAVLADLAKNHAGDQGTEAALALAKVDPKSAIAAEQIAKAATSDKPGVPAATLLSALKKMSAAGNENAPAGLASLATSPGASEKIRKQAMNAAKKLNPEQAEAVRKALWAAAEGDEANKAAVVSSLVEMTDNPEQLEKLTAMIIGDEQLQGQLPGLLKRLPNGGADTIEKLLASDTSPEQTAAIKTQLHNMADSDAGRKQLQQIQSAGAPASQAIASLLLNKAPKEPSPEYATELAKLAQDSQHTDKAVKMLSQLGDVGIQQLATLALSDSATPDARQQAIAALTQKGEMTEAKSQALKQIASTEKGAAGDQATLALVKSGVAEPKMLERLLSADNVPQKETLAAIKALGNKATDALPMLAKLANDGPPSKELQEAIAAVAPKGSNLEELTKSLASDDADARSAALDKMLTSRTPEAQSVPTAPATPTTKPPSTSVAGAEQLQQTDMSATHDTMSGSSPAVPSVASTNDEPKTVVSSAPTQELTSGNIINVSPSTTTTAVCGGSNVISESMPALSVPTNACCVPVQCCSTAQCPTVGCRMSCCQQCSPQPCRIRRSCCRVIRCQFRCHRRCR